MKSKHTMLSTENARLLFDHIFDGFKSSHAGIKQLKEKDLIDEGAYTELLEKNSQRLIERIHEFKLSHRMLCIFFVLLFGWLQINGDDLDMRRTSTRVRPTTARSMRGQRSGRRKENIT